MKKNLVRNMIVVAIVIGVVGGGTYYGIHRNDNSKVANANQVQIQDKTQLQQAQKEQDVKHQEVIASMEKGHWDLNKELGYINPIYKGYNPNIIVPNENLIQSAQTYAVPANEVVQMINGTYTGPNKNQKMVFLTFDDGPSPNNTPKILNILEENNVHATFFDIGTYLKSNPTLQKVVRQELMNGDAIGDHTFNHEYTQLYPGNSVNVAQYIKQDNETATLLNNILGPNFNTRILRMPGGYMSRRYYNDPNLPALNEAFDKEHITAIDWNTETGDAESNGQINENELISTMEKQLNGKNQAIVLMHDAGAKVDTVEALPAVIKYFKEKGYAFKVIENAPTNSFNNLPSITKGNSNQLPN